MPKGKGYKDSPESKRRAFIKEMTAATKPATKKKPVSRVKRLKRTVKELIGGSKTYLPKKAKSKTESHPGSARSVLKRNLTEKEIGKFK